MTTPFDPVADLQACTTLLATFYRGLDMGAVDAAAAVMAPGGVWHRQGIDHVGPDAVRAIMLARDSQRKTCHVMSNPLLVESAPEQVVLRYYLSAYVQQGGNTVLHGILDCRDAFTRSEAGLRLSDKASMVHLRIAS